MGGAAVFEPFFKAYIQRFKDTPLNSDDFKVGSSRGGWVDTSWPACWQGWLFPVGSSVATTCMWGLNGVGPVGATRLPAALSCILWR